MNVRIHKSEPAGLVRIPASKSYTIRAALCAAMASGHSLLRRPLASDDADAVFGCLETLGAIVDRSADSVAIDGGALHAPSVPLWCNESAATMRFLMAVAATLPGTTVLRCAPSLARRPMGPLCEALAHVGAECAVDPTDGAATIHGVVPVAGNVTMRGDVSSQYVSALLLSAPLYPAGLEVRLETPLVSKRYVDMTRACMSAFGVDVKASVDGRGFDVPVGGYTAAEYLVEGDWSAAAAMLALGAAAGSARIAGLNSQSLQADIVMLDVVERCGASFAWSDDSLDVARVQMRPFEIDMSGAIDLLPVTMALAATAPGATTVRGIARARDKESDRVAAMTDGLRNMGVTVDAQQDLVKVWGGAARGAVVSSYGDHRIAMAFGVLGAVVGGTTVLDAGCVGKTYPDFWNDLQRLGVRLEYDE